MSLKHAILVLLETEPSSGYDLLKHFKRSLGYFWNAKHQQVYQQLKSLAENGLITYDVQTQEGKPDKKVYAITPSGIDELKRWLNSPVKPSKINDALLVKIYGGHLADNDALQAELEEHIHTNEQTLNELLDIEKIYLALPETERNKYQLPYLTLRRGILSEQTWLAWADEARKTIKK